jgi:hypothetical protein
MDDLPAYFDSDGDTGVGTDPVSTTSAPRWVRVFGIIVIVLVLLSVIFMFTGVFGGEHGPGSHIPSSSVTEHDGQQP